MTQMMLFEPAAKATVVKEDEPQGAVAKSTPSKNPRSRSVTPRKPASKSDPVQPSSRLRQKPESNTTAPERVEGVQHMSDLARAVLLRYELAVRYREEVAERRRKAMAKAK